MKRTASDEKQQKTNVTRFGEKVEAAAPAKAAADPTWLTQLTQLGRMLLVLSGATKHSKAGGDTGALYETVLTESWRAAQVELGADCLVLIENLPSTASAAASAAVLSSVVAAKLRRDAPVVLALAGCAFVECVSGAAAVEVIRTVSGRTLDVDGSTVTLKVSSFPHGRCFSHLLQASEVDLSRGPQKIRKSTKIQDQLLCDFLASRLLVMPEGVQVCFCCCYLFC